MSPKYRGDSDDWFDDQANAKRTAHGAKKSKKGKPTEAQTVAYDEANGIVAEVFPKQCRVRMIPEPGQDQKTIVEILCQYRRAQVFGDHLEKAPVATGDRVAVEKVSSTDGIVYALAPRKNKLVRGAPSRANQVQVLTANLDCLVIVSSVVNPEFSEGIIDRFFVAAHAGGNIPSVLVINKLDRLEAAPENRRLWKIYSDLGYPVFEVSAKAGIGLDSLKKFLLNKSVAFCGHSGVGKTSLLSALLKSDAGKVGDVSSVTGKGKHTTTSAILLKGPEKSLWIDTPGVREFALAGITPEDLVHHFPEMMQTECFQKRSCTHFDEEGCQAKGLSRYDSYRRIYQSLIEAQEEAGQ